MNIQIFPNYFKKIALIGFFVFFIFHSGDDFVDGFNAGKNGFSFSEAQNYKGEHYLENYFGEKKMYYFEVVSILFLIVYMLSKEKVEDDFIKLLRLESYQFSFLIIIFLSLFLLIFGLNYKYGLMDTMTIFMFLYLIIFAIKKRSI